MHRFFSHDLRFRLVNPVPFVQVIIGPRQVGKTTAVKQLLAELSFPSIYASADLPSPPSVGWINEQWSKVRALEGERILVLDEIQKIGRWSEVVKSLYDQDRRSGLRVVLLGSASLSLERGLSESLLGRFELIRAPHWTFAECREVFNWDLSTYLAFGGYPAPATLSTDSERWRQFMLDSIIEPVISRDILLLREIAKPALFRQTLELALRHPAQELSFQKILGQLQDRGNASTIKSYLESLEGAYLIKLLYKFSNRAITTKSSSPKIIPLCSALISAFVNPQRVGTDPVWRGKVLEAAVGSHLNLLFRDKVSYWRDGKYEVDYVVQDEDELFAIEVTGAHNENHTQKGLITFQELFPKAKKVLMVNQSIEKFLSITKKSLGIEFLNQLAT